MFFHRIRTRYDSAVKSSSLGVIGFAPRRCRRRPARVATRPGPPCRAAGTVRATRRRPYSISDFAGPEVVFYALAWPNELVDEASRAIRRPYWPKYGKNHRLGGANGQTGSRDMAATSFFESATPTSYSSPPNTLWCLSRIVTELSLTAVTVTLL